MISSNTNKIVACETDRRCEHCGRQFHRDTTLLKHICEQKRRWLDRDQPANRIAWAAWQQYYRTCHPSKRDLEYSVFQRNAYYLAFVKFGHYCVDVRVINPAAFVSCLIRNRTPIDNWASDRTYTKYLVEYLRLEDSMEAVHRSIESLLNVSQEQNIALKDVFTYVNSNKICHMISTGRVSPWLLYNSDTGREFLSRLNAEQSAMIMDYIDPERWQIKFLRSENEVSQVKTLLNEIYK